MAESLLSISQEISAASAIGVGQTWQNVSRAFAVNYLNDTGRSIQVVVSADTNYYLNDNWIDFYVSADGTNFVLIGRAGHHPEDGNAGYYETSCISAIVPAGHWYVCHSQGMALAVWSELR